MAARWQPNPDYGEPDVCDILVNDEGEIVGVIEDFGYAAYPSALNAATGNWERHGPCIDRVAGMLWAERVSGQSPAKTGDNRPAFYYDPKDAKE